ncbi:MAG: hypothetical protein NC084_09485 [Bacteroides sp.]|nr:hypothetical protein [Eubacterium sp.]MCM1417485.1 hypothetical protein [Roseburia sp.]MCM1462929.1 hypothetical protein [Bacteroides sp.]
MMFRLMYRLKKKHGAVLFMVIGIMALLIAMSTAAYYTARGSYNTVASSYSYSQLYLSAISAADMVSAAIMNQPIPAASGGNNFAAVKTAVDTDLNPIQQSDGTFAAPTNVIYMKSGNLGSITYDASTTSGDIIDELNKVEPIEQGVLDGLTVKISAGLKSANMTVTSSSTDSSNPSKDVVTEKGTIAVTYFIETTAYYNGDMISVQDVVTNDKQVERKKNIPVTLTPGASTSFPPLNPNASTGQGKLGVDGTSTSTGRGVLVSVKRLDGNMTFHNDITWIGTSASNVGNKIDGSLVSHGSMYFSKCNVNVSGTDNHWYIGGDFVTTNDQTGTIKLNQNNLYVGGDMILGTQQTVQAKEIFVDGDLYVLKQCTIDTEKLHVSGNIYFVEYNPDGSPRPAAAALEKAVEGDRGITGDTGNVNARLSGNFTLELGGDVVAAGKNAPHEEWRWNGTTGKNEVVTVQNEITAGQTVKIGNNYSSVKDGSNYQTIEGVENFDKKAQLEGGYTVLVRDDKTDKYVPEQREGSLLDAIADNTNQTVNAESGTVEKGEQITYPNYTAKQETYNNSLTLDFSDMEAITEEQADGTTKIVGYKKECPVTDESGNEIATACIKIDGSDVWNAQDVTVNIPYVEEGFVLNYANPGFMGGDISGNATVKYNIVSDPSTITDPDAQISTTQPLAANKADQKSMPIVLASNTTDGNSFSWKGDGYSNNGSGAYVSVSDDMKVSFEMGNLDTTTTPGVYKPYDNVADNENKVKIPTYILGQKTAVGSESLINIMESENTFLVSKDENNGNVKIGNTPLTDSTMPENNIMLISNSSGTAFRADYQNSVVGGYLYAPSGQLAASNDTNGAVINIGSVVISDYEANHADYHVVLPRPSDMDAFIGPLSNKSNSTGDPTRVQNPGSATYDTPNIKFGNWNLVGSNYVGS